jgi:tellurite resistance protein
MIASPRNPLAATGQRGQVHTLYRLVRKAGVSSDPGASVSSAHCPNCGAPITSDLSSACAFCHVVLNDGTRGWILREITPASSDAGRQLIAQIQAQIPQAAADQSATVGHGSLTPSGLLAWAVKIIAADGNIDPPERQWLESLAEQSGVAPGRLQEIITMALADRLDVPDPPDRAAARVWLGAMASAALADGILEPREIALLNAAAQRFGFSPADVSLLIRQQQNERLAAARDGLRAGRLREGGAAGDNRVN